MRKFSTACCLLLIILGSCKESSATMKPDENQVQGSRVSNTTPNMGDSSPHTPPGEVLKLVKHEVVDRLGTGLVASTYLLPEGWTVQDKLFWEYNDATVPIRFQANLKKDDGTMAIQIFPDVRSSWNSGPSGTWGYPPPSDIITGMKELIKQERKGKTYKFTNEKVLLNANQNTAQGRQNAQAGVIIIEFEENGKLYEEEFYAKLDIATMVTPSMMGNMQSVIWAASGMFACKALKGNLEECRKIAQTVASSARLTKPFYNRLAQVIQLLSDQVYAKIYQAGQISKIISQTNDRMIANIDASYRQSQAASDLSNSQFSDYMRGVDRYNDGGSEVQLPSGYDNAWVNDRGEYILTNSTGYDPGRDYNGNWKQLHRQN